MVKFSAWHIHENGAADRSDLRADHLLGDTADGCGTVRLKDAESNSSTPPGAGGFEPVPNWLSAFTGFTGS
jgi:hypothetical protein